MLLNLKIVDNEDEKTALFGTFVPLRIISFLHRQERIQCF